MIYPGMLWAELPVKSVYDTQMMLASINAAKDLYEKGLQEMKDYKKEYGDFYSPFLKDMDWYALNVTGKVRDAINYMYANGIDPMRSAEGRTFMSNIINSIDPGIVGLMRANAKTGYEFLDAMKKLLAAGKFDPNMQNYYLQRQGLPAFDSFSTIDPETGQMRSWNQSSPIEASNLRDLTIEGFLNLKHPHDLTPQEAKELLGSAYDPRARYKGITYKDVFDTAGEYVTGLTGDWRMDYFKDLARQKALSKNPNATEEDINRQFQKDVADSQLQWIQEPVSDYSLWERELSLGLLRAKMIQDQHNADRSFMLEMEKAGITIDPGTGRFISKQPTDGIILPIEARQLDKVTNVKNDALTNYQLYMLAAIQQNKNIIDEYNKEKTASTLGYREEKMPEGQFVFGPSAVAPVYSKLNSKRTPYIKDKNSEEQLNKMKLRAEVAKANIGMYNMMLKGGPEVMKKFGYLDDNYVPTAKYYDFISKTYLNKKDLKNMSKKDIENRINMLYNSLYSAGDLVAGEYKDYIKLQYGGTNKGKIPGIEGNYRIISTGRYRYTPVHRADLFGINIYSKNSIERKFDEWFANNKQAWVWNEDDINDAFPGTRSGEKYEHFGSILIKRKDLEDFASKYNKSVEEVANELGLTRHTGIVHQDKEDVEKYYYEVPATTNYGNNGGFNYSRTNQAVNKNQFGGKINYDETPNAQSQSVMY